MRKQTLRQLLEKALETHDPGSVVVLAKDNHQVLSQLVRLAYDKETLAGWRAITAIGAIAREMAKTDYPVLREMVRKLLWSLSDESGGIGWSAPEILGEIVSADTVRFRDVVPLIAEVYTIEEKVFRPGVIYALYRIAQSDPAAVVPHAGLAIEALTDPDPLVRVYALKLVAELTDILTAQEALTIQTIRKKLSSDRAEVWIYQDGQFLNIAVGELVLKLKKG